MSRVQAESGVRVLKKLLDSSFDLRSAKLDEFRAWLTRQLEGWRKNHIFALKCQIRDIYSAHPRLAELHRAHAAAVEADENSAEYARLVEIERELHSAEQAIRGIRSALPKTPVGKRKPLKAKLEGFLVSVLELDAEATRLEKASGERQHLQQVTEELEGLRARLGLDKLQAELDKAQKGKGKRANASGSTFETLAYQVALEQIVPRYQTTSDSAQQRLVVLTGVTLGGARTEIDQVMIRRPLREGKSVDVLAIGEAKTNINDLAHGFRMRQENLAWLTGDTDNYDDTEYRTQVYRDGHFDKPFVHEHDGETYLFDRASFRLFRRDAKSKWFLKRLYLISRQGPVWGISNSGYSQLRSRVATDPSFDLDSNAYLSELLQWFQSLAHALETPDVLRLYCSSTTTGRNVVLL